ncbi:hypothetical protein QL285_035754 [Trifolium repens]|nr:hypothetical protein QL285_035754 [Trifolium repens]
MMGGAPNHGGGTDTNMTLTDAVTELRRLQANVTTMDQEKEDKGNEEDEDEINDSQPLAQTLWDARVPENFKTPHLPAFDGKWGVELCFRNFKTFSNLKLICSG